MVSAVVFAYHNVGVRCLSALLAHGIQVKLVVTHTDDQDENIWFDSVANLATLHGIPVVCPKNPNTESLLSQLQQLNPDFIFSFYYRSILSENVLNTARRGRYNMHGSLLPKYRGRAPVNWAVLHGETQSGATLHEMVKKPDAGAIVGQMAVPILPNDTAADVFSKVLVAAEMVLHNTLPAIVDGTVPRQTMDITQGSYFGGRTPQDGIIDWKAMGTRQIHNLVRAVSHPYPGAFTDTASGRLVIWRTMLVEDSRGHPIPPAKPCLWQRDGQVFATTCDGGILRIVSAQLDGHLLDPAGLPDIF
ncbi:formyl transferase [Aspergillus bertholletiae]|uniref:Formyl transferase n=1 Tax=Aspergillus bertholletiae TaxID=1226010 RepID=A0A5N7AVD3_9EURO|nr:formyl transferase [Aspergillus bertholletiae]